MFAFQIVVSLIIFALGVCIGSFLHVLVYRTIEDKEDWKKGRSRCDHCSYIIRWYDNIPLLSFLLLRGKCRKCHKPIAVSHVAMELLMGTLFVWWYWAGSFFFLLVDQPFTLLQPLFWLFIGVLGLVIFVTDVKYLIIPDWAVALMAIATVVYRLVLLQAGILQPGDFKAMILAALLVGASFWLLRWATKNRGMGFGDVKLAPVLALLVGWPQILVALMFAVCSGAVVGSILLIVGKHKRMQPIAFGPFLLLGSAFALVWGDALWGWYWTLLLGM
ncbi:prepilin peptidase [Candidatus Woesebacteria bacterium]|nr:prepilin peptidase [Candidatus Woesebacteria bacterium]